MQNFIFLCSVCKAQSAFNFPSCKYIFEGFFKKLLFFRRRVKELEVDVVQVGNLLRSMEINEEKAYKDHDKSSNKLEDKKKEFEEVVLL